MVLRAIVRFVEGDEPMRHWQPRVEATVLQHVDALGRALALAGSVTVHVRHDPNPRVPDIGGRASSRDEVFLCFDAQRSDAARLVDAGVPHALAHELHHVARWHSLGYGTTLLEAIVTEGLGERFADAWFDRDPGPRSCALTGVSIVEAAGRALASAHAPYDHAAWFLDRGDDTIERWSGYALGYIVVGNYLRAHPGTSAAALVNTPAGVFEPWLAQLMS